MGLFQKKKSWIERQEGLAPATGVLLYVGLFGLFITNAESMFPKFNRTLGPMMMLMLLSFSVMVCGLLVFYQPYMLFVDKKGKEAMKLLVSTTKWLGVFALLIMMVAGLMSQG